MVESAYSSQYSKPFRELNFVFGHVYSEKTNNNMALALLATKYVALTTQAILANLLHDIRIEKSERAITYDKDPIKNIDRVLNHVLFERSFRTNRHILPWKNHSGQMTGSFGLHVDWLSEGAGQYMAHMYIDRENFVSDHPRDITPYSKAYNKLIFMLYGASLLSSIEQEVDLISPMGLVADYYDKLKYSLASRTKIFNKLTGISGTMHSRSRAFLDRHTKPGSLDKDYRVFPLQDDMLGFAKGGYGV